MVSLTLKLPAGPYAFSPLPGHFSPNSAQDSLSYTLWSWLTLAPASSTLVPHLPSMESMPLSTLQSPPHQRTGQPGMRAPCPLPHSSVLPLSLAPASSLHTTSVQPTWGITRGHGTLACPQASLQGSNPLLILQMKAVSVLRSYWLEGLWAVLGTVPDDGPHA